MDTEQKTLPVGFERVGGQIHCEKLSLESIADKTGTPVYVYSKKHLKERAEAFLKAFSSHPTLVCFAVKANSNLEILKLFSEQGLGADVVSIGELKRSQAAGFRPDKIVFSGVGKRDEELIEAVRSGLFAINVESVGELRRLDALTRDMDLEVSIGLRVNPDIEVETNPYIATGLYTTKFGLPEAALDEVLAEFSQNKRLRWRGLSCHIGSQIVDKESFEKAAHRMVALAKKFRQLGVDLDFLDLGGGLGVRYQNEKPPSVQTYARSLLSALKGSDLNLVLEPGRNLCANSAVLVTRILGTKGTPKKKFAIVDAAMTELIRPSLYQSWHLIELANQKNGESEKVDIVGPVCESGDFLATDRQLPLLYPGELLTVFGAGAYARSMASNYNSRPFCPEVLVDGDKASLVRRRQDYEELWSQDCLTPLSVSLGS